MNNKIYKAFSITLSLSLSGCMGIYEGGFECPAGTGVGCKSISDVNEMVNLGDLPQSLKDSRDMASDSTDKTYKCDTCGRSFFPTQTKPEIWINPLYLKNRKEPFQEHIQAENKQQKVDDDTISL